MKIKRISLLALIVAFTLTLAAGLGIVGKSTAKAADESATPAATFEMTTGASLRLSGETDGIRFRVRMDETLAGKVKSGEIALKFVISTKYSFDNAAGDYAGIAKKLEIAVDKNKVYLGSADRPDETGYYFANAVMTELKETSRKIDFVAVAYYVDAAGNTVYATIPADNQRSMYGVINTLVTEKGETYAQEILSAAVYNWYGTETYPLEIKTQDGLDKLAALINSGKIDLKDAYANVADGLNLEGINKLYSYNGAITAEEPTGVVKAADEVNHYTLKGWKRISGRLYTYEPEFNAVAHTYQLDTSDENADYLVCDCGTKKADYVFNKKISAVQDIKLEDSNYLINLTGISEYSVLKSIKLNSYDLGTTLTALNISDEIKTNKQLHGEQNLTVVVSDEQGDHNVIVPVVLITKEIKTAEEWRTALGKSAYTDEKLYGYYRLANDIGKLYGAEYIWGGIYAYGDIEGQKGFKGTFDGNGHTAWVVANQTGLFGSVGSGAKIKNLTINNYSYGADSTKIFGFSMSHATVENVTISVEGKGITDTTKPGLITEAFCYHTEFINLNVTIKCSIGSFIGSSNGEIYVRKNTFVNCAVKAKADYQYATWNNGASNYPLSWLANDGLKLTIG